MKFLGLPAGSGLFEKGGTIDFLYISSLAFISLNMLCSLEYKLSCSYGSSKKYTRIVIYHIRSHNVFMGCNGSPPVFSGVRVVRYLVFCVSLFVLLFFFFWPLCCLSFFFWPLCCLSFFFWPLCCLSFFWPLCCLSFFFWPLCCLSFDLLILITHLVSLNSSNMWFVSLYLLDIV